MKWVGVSSGRTPEDCFLVFNFGHLDNGLTELPYDPAIPLLGIYLEKMKTLITKDTCTPMSIAVLFTVAKT